MVYNDQPRTHDHWNKWNQSVGRYYTRLKKFHLAKYSEINRGSKSGSRESKRMDVCNDETNWFEKQQQ